LHIADNLITRCMWRNLKPVTQAMQWLIGYGGIALAKVSDLRILRNEIVRNGTSHLQPVCGVFAIFVQGLQLDNNRILDNGPKNGDAAEKAQNGLRGGVHIWLLLPVVEQMITHSTPSKGETNRIGWSGIPACSVRDNSIRAPLGRALTFLALGPVVVARNRLVTQGMTGKNLDLIATTVLIGDVGLSNEWTLGLLAILVAHLYGHRAKSAQMQQLCAFAKTSGLINSTKPPTFWPPVVEHWATGKLLVTENQITLDLIGERRSFGISSIFAFTLDDLGFTDNQCEITTTNVFFLANAVLLGGSVRLSDDRLSEAWMHAGFSALSIGGMNTTTDNQSTHCIMAQSFLPGLRVFRDNLALIRAFCPDECSGSGFE
jgi:hypothetical protein